MNIELFFVKTECREALRDLIVSRLNSLPDAPGKQPDWGLPPSYDVIISCDHKRKIVVSPVENGWVLAIESKEVVDFILLSHIALQLKTDVIAIQLSDATGSCGYACCCNGELRESFFSENEFDSLTTLRQYLKRHGISHDLLTFREAVRRQNSGWLLLQGSGR